MLKLQVSSVRACMCDCVTVCVRACVYVHVCVCARARAWGRDYYYAWGGTCEQQAHNPQPQVGIFGDIAGWQRNLERVSNLYDTDEEGGLHGILQGA